MDLFAALHSRRSHCVLVAPGPGQDDVREMISAAAAAPDHGRRTPWRFTILAGEGKDSFADVLEKALRTRTTDAGAPDEKQVARERAKLDRAPTVIVTASLGGDGEDKIPPRERYAATCAATQNLLLAATALGFGSIWRTGWPVTDPTVKEALGLDECDDIVGFVYIGTVPEGQVPAPRGPSGVISSAWPHDRGPGTG